MKIAFTFSATVRRKQGGVSLVIALIALVAMTLAGLALIRAVDTSNVISGNLAFRQATLHATDVGVETALTTLGTIVTSSLDANYPGGCASGACNYYPTKQAVNAAGIPTAIDWALVPGTSVDASYAVQYVIDRLCDGPTPVTDITAKCMHTTESSVGSKKAGSVSFTSAQQVYYRATIRAVGPRNTVSIVQVLYAR
ncbi:MAG: hypothetical protein Q7K57_32965 [Burkholderiaceae bacterium]|nr:hypothetical protein [Burkholderiaceae bacterium]